MRRALRDHRFSKLVFFAMRPRQPFQGSQRKLVLAFDVGTTFSGVSYSLLDPGLVPEIRGVTRHVISGVCDRRPNTYVSSLDIQRKRA
jgi:hypothetical protein